MIQWKESIRPMKAIRIFFRSIKNGFKSISRNFSLSLASVICTTITLVIVAIAMVVSANINNFTKDLENTLTIMVFVDKNATQDDIGSVKSKILEIKNIKSDELIYKTKEDIKNDTIESMCKEGENTSSLCVVMNNWTEETNPLESEFILTVQNIEELDKTAESLRSIDKVTNVKYSKDIVDKMIPAFSIIKKITIGIIIGLIVVSVFLICNTIKLTIFARKSEIEIMRLVGTSNFTIKLPFVVEGLFLGIIGALIPVVGTIWGYIIAYDKLDHHLFTNFIEMINPMPFTIYTSLVLVGIGAVVGMFGSYITVRRYLKIWKSH